MNEKKIKLLALRVDDGIYKKLKSLADKEKRTLSNYIYLKLSEVVKSEHL